MEIYEYMYSLDRTCCIAWTLDNSKGYAVTLISVKNP